MRRKAGGNVIQEQFAELGIHQELNRAKQTIDELTFEIQTLRSQGKKIQEEQKVIELRSTLQREGIVQLELNDIEPNPHQPRKTFTKDSILLLSRSLERDGQQQPILVFQINEKRYFLFDGERRWRAARKLEWEKIQAVIVPIKKKELIENPDSLRRQALLVNHHRENLNPLDLAEALVWEIAASLGIDTNQSPKLLSAAITRLSRKNQLNQISELITKSSQEQEQEIWQLEKAGIVKELESKVLIFLLSLQLNPISVKTNIFPTLNLFDDLKEAIRKQGLGGHQARLLQQLSPKNLEQTELQAKTIRQIVTKEIITKKLSVAATRKRIREELAKHCNFQQPKLSKVTRNAIAGIEKVKIDELSPDELEALESSLKQKLKEVSSVLRR